MEQLHSDGGEIIQISKLSRVHPFAAVLDNNQDLVPNPILKFIRRTNLVLYIILLISAIAVITTYSIIWKETISPKLNLSETGNIWSFVLLFSTCGIVILVASFIIFRNVQGSQLKFKQGFRCVLVLAACAGALGTVWIGAAESVRFQKGSGPSKNTTFGIYIHKVCGSKADKNSTSEGGVNQFIIKYDNCRITKANVNLFTLLTKFEDGRLPEINWGYSGESEMIPKPGMGAVN
ncbi:hypothetical protein Fcan01_22921 [Folsomia candida]|uniref:Uncharacterized protein n=1 Tax=Folsomia candida TaxID=158441 RepID=A0A226D9T4_FOLCA|nr:hypothetical protein Fcan01_22921 [Folsomia candida]